MRNLCDDNARIGAGTGLSEAPPADRREIVACRLTRGEAAQIEALLATMLSGERLPDPHNAEPVSVASRIPLPAPLRAVLLGALDVRARRHHSAVSMAETLAERWRVGRDDGSVARISEDEAESWILARRV